MLLLAGLALPSRAAAQRADAAPTAVYRIYFAGAAGLQQLAASLDIWSVNHAEGYLVAPLTPEQAESLQATHRIEAAPLPGPMPLQTLAAQDVTSIPDFACYRTVEETADTLAALAATYPQLARIKTIGVSWEKQTPGGPAGYDLDVLVLTNRTRPDPKFRFFLMGAIHARELATAETTLRFAESLLAGYGVDADATWLLDYGELHLLPIANPDGRKRAETGLLWRKNTNRSDAACIWSPDSDGVDLNRNSSFKWNSCFGCSSGVACDLTYRGRTPASEPETQALESYLRTLFVDARPPEPDAAVPETTPGLLLSLHSYGGYVLYPWGWTSLPAPNAAALQTLGRKLGYFTQYNACQIGAEGCFYQTDGSIEDWLYGELGIPGYTIEMGDWFFEPCETYEAGLADATLAALRYAFKAAQAPYQTPAGPEVVAVTPSTVTLAAGDPFTVTAQADDTRSYGGVYGSDPAQPIQAARAGLDFFPWQAPRNGWAMHAADGSFDQPQEALALEIETACWSAGRHLLFLQAQDRSGRWGVPSAALVEVTDAAQFSLQFTSLPSVPYPGRPATYAISITNRSPVTDSYTLAGEPATWQFDLPAQPAGPVAPGATIAVTFTATAPRLEASPAEQARIVVTSTAQPGKCLDVGLMMPDLSLRRYFPFLPTLPPLTRPSDPPTG
ncbi:MAG: peptidase M14 [Caldilineaceae bacterium]|nr:peptidase M14 [Caldilineaceae bacterium]